MLARVQGCAAGAGLAQVLMRLLEQGGTETRASNRTAPIQTSQSNVSGLQLRQRVLVLAALESYVAVSAHPCPHLLLQVRGYNYSWGIISCSLT